MKKPILFRILTAVVGILAAAPGSSRAQLPDSLYVGEASGNTVDTINETVGGAGASLVTGLDHPAGVAVAGNNLYVANAYTGVIGEYNATTGAAINASLISLPGGVNSLVGGMVVSGGLLYVVNGGSDTVGVYDATTGATVNDSLVQGLTSPFDLAVTGNALYVTGQFTGQNTGTVSEFNATTGAAINGALVTSSAGLQGIAVSGNTLFVVNNSLGTIGAFNATSGLAINTALVTGLSGPAGLVVSGNDLYVAENNNGTVGEYNATTGVAVLGFIPPASGTLDGPTFLAVATVPEPSTWALLGIGAIGMGLTLHLQRRRARRADSDFQKD